MAILKNPNRIFWRSRIGSTVGQINRGNPGARRSVKPANRRHSKQQIFRGQMNQVVLAWNALTTLEKLDWDLFGDAWQITDKYGNPAYLSGFNWFVRFNKSLLAYGSSMISAPPANPTPSYTPSFSITEPGGLGNLVVTPSPNVSGGNKIYVHRRLNSFGSTFWPPKPLPSFRHFDSNDSSPFVIAQSAEVLTGNFKHWFQFDAIDSNGRRPGSIFDFNVSVSL